MTVKIREYTKKDKNDLIKLIIYLQNFESDLEPGILNRGETIAHEYLDKLLENVSKKSGKIMLAVNGTGIVGIVAGYPEEDPDEIELTDKKYFYISDIAVYPEYHGKGIGKALLTQMENFAKSIGIRQLQINVLSRNTNAHKIYMSLGYRDYENILVKKL